jgi:hypothetical protein
MKTNNIIKKFAIGITFCLLLLNVAAFGQEPPPPPDSHGSNGNQSAGAPVDGGVGLLVGLGLAYGVRKLYRLRKEKQEHSDQNNPA